jgi:hypothetical protein
MEEEFTWATPEELTHCSEALSEFHLAYPDKPRSSQIQLVALGD